MHCAAGRSTHQQQRAMFNARSRLSGKQCFASAAQRNFTSSRPYQSFLTYRERTGGSLQPVRREPPATRSSLLKVGAHTARLGCIAAVGSPVSLCIVSTDTGLVDASRVPRLDCTDRCSKQQQPVAISAQPRSFRLPGFHNQIVVKSISIQ